MKNASSRCGMVLLILLGLTLLAVASVAIFGGSHIAIDTYWSQHGVLSVMQPSMPDGEINVNTADLDMLMLLPGIGETIAMEIIIERKSNGPFHFPEDLLAVKGIGAKKLESILPHIRLDDKH